MPKGYIIARIDILDPVAYARYAAEALKVAAAHGGKALARGGRYEALEGRARARNVVLEFDSYDAGPSITRPSIRRRARCARARPRWKSCWWKVPDALGSWPAPPHSRRCPAGSSSLTSTRADRNSAPHARIDRPVDKRRASHPLPAGCLQTCFIPPALLPCAGRRKGAQTRLGPSGRRSSLSKRRGRGRW
jgi:uncharacterized protein (DUF1330 family)